jgi:hypothetical protein
MGVLNGEMGDPNEERGVPNWESGFPNGESVLLNGEGAPEHGVHHFMQHEKQAVDVALTFSIGRSNISGEKVFPEISNC